MHIREIQVLREEYQNAERGWMRAAFGSIVRRCYGQIKEMPPDERRQFIKFLGAPSTYMTELCKELKGVEYDQIFRN